MAAKRSGFARARKAAGFTQESLAAALHVDRSTVVRWEAGKSQPWPYLWPLVDQTLSTGMASHVRLDLIEERVAEHLHSYTRTAPLAVLYRLVPDFLEVQSLAAERQPAIVQSRLSEATALLSLLSADALMKLGDVTRARYWYGTARLAADDMLNVELRASVRAQQAMLPYYYGQPEQTVRLAREAQALISGIPCHPTALAVAAEARALARLGNTTDAEQTMCRAQDRTRIVLTRARDVVRAIPSERQCRPLVGELRELVRSQRSSQPMTIPDCGLASPTEEHFTPTVTRPVVDAACGLVGLDAANAVLLRHQTNGVYQLVSAPVVVKVARPGTHQMRQIVSLVRWLSGQGVPTVRLLEHIEQPIVVHGYDVTLWSYLPQTRPVLAGDIAEPLAALHQVPMPPVNLPHLDALAAIHRNIERSRILTIEEQAILRGKWERLSELVPRLTYDRQPRLLHGDPQHRNMLWDEQANQSVLCDWEGAVIGPVEWDLVTIEIHCRRFGRAQHEYHDFCERYGTDIRAWPGYLVLRDLRELRMITTNARKSPANSWEAQEVHRRVAQLDAGPWEP